MAQVLGDVCGLAFGTGCFTLSLEIRYKQAVPLLINLLVDAKIESTEERAAVEERSMLLVHLDQQMGQH